MYRVKSNALHRIDNDRLTEPKKNEITSLWHLLGSNVFGKINSTLLFSSHGSCCSTFGRYPRQGKTPQLQAVESSQAPRLLNHNGDNEGSTYIYVQRLLKLAN